MVKSMALWNNDIEIDVIIKNFVDRKTKAKDTFKLQEIDKTTAHKFISQHHYLGKAKFFSKYNFGIYIQGTLVGCATYSNPQGIAALKSWFNMDNSVQDVLELSRLCLLPKLNGTNATSYLLGNSIKLLRNKSIQAVITLADDSRHVGSIYQVCNFKYYGLTDKKTDFYTADHKINPRGSTQNQQGVWLPRTQKHRYCYILNKNLKPLLTEQPKPTINNTKQYNCCSGTNIVFDNRFKKHYTCPKCTGELNLLSDL